MNVVLPPGPLSVICLAAHPDDVEIACGGTLLSLAAAREIAVTTLVMTGSEPRRREAIQAAEAFVHGTKVEFGGDLDDFVDGYLPERWGVVKRRVHLLAESNPTPDLVFAPRPDDAHQDHRLLGRLAPTVWRNSLILQYEIPKWDGDLGRPNVYVPLTDDVATRKVRLLNDSYPSQHGRDWWDDELFLGFMRLRGIECKNRYAEGFNATKVVLEP